MSKETKKVTFIPIPIRSNEHLAAALKRIRKLKGLSQMELARKTGLTQATISRVENANHKVEIRTLFLILAALQSDLMIIPRQKMEGPTSIEGLF